MTKDSINHERCTCPRCEREGLSVAAMHYRETQLWDKHGRFSGSGFGVGSGGLGIGIGGGSYSEEGQIATKRARTFAEPKPYSLALATGAVLASAAALITVVSFGPSVAGLLSSTAGGEQAAVAGSDLSAVMGTLGGMAQYLPFAVVPVALLFAARAVLKNGAAEERHNAEVYPAEVARYNELRYCEHCNSLFDSRGNARDASAAGFAEMMAMRG